MKSATEQLENKHQVKWQTSSMLKRIDVFYLLSVKLLQTIIIERLRFKEIFWTQKDAHFILLLNMTTMNLLTSKACK